MACFSNTDLKKRRELLKMSAADLAEMVGCEPSTIYKYESHKVVPDPDMMYAIAEAFGDMNIWYDWMRTEYPASYGRLHPEIEAYTIPGAMMQMYAEISDVMDLQREAMRDAADGKIDCPEIARALEKEASEALGAMQRFLNVLKAPTKGAR